MSSNFAIEIDEAIIRRAQQGDRRAFQTLYQAFATPAYNLARRMTRSESMAEEVLQEGMLLVYRRLEQFRFESPFWGWVRMIFVNTTLSLLRSNSRRDKVISLHEVLEGESRSRDTVPMDLEKALAKLSDKRRSVMWLYAVEGYTHQEIAEMLATTVSDSKIQLFRAREQLRTWWHDEHGESANTSMADELR